MYVITWLLCFAQLRSSADDEVEEANLIHWWEYSDIKVKPGAIIEVDDHSSESACLDVLYPTIVSKAVERQRAQYNLLPDQPHIPVMQSCFSKGWKMSHIWERLQFACCVVRDIFYFQTQRMSPIFYIDCPPHWKVIRETADSLYGANPNVRGKCITPEEWTKMFLVQFQLQGPKQSTGASSSCLNVNAAPYIPQSVRAQKVDSEINVVPQEAIDRQRQNAMFWLKLYPRLQPTNVAPKPAEHTMEPLSTAINLPDDLYDDTPYNLCIESSVPYETFTIDMKVKTSPARSLVRMPFSTRQRKDAVISMVWNYAWIS